jgi:hypothetical protein
MDNEKKRLKMAIISGASHAIRFKEKNVRATEDEVVRHVAKQVDEILSKIDEEL